MTSTHRSMPDRLHGYEESGVRLLASLQTIWKLRGSQESQRADFPWVAPTTSLLGDDKRDGP